MAKLKKNNVEHIFILVDQDDKNEKKRKKLKYKLKDCPMVVVKEILGYRDNGHYSKDNQIFVVMTREMEAWFLADPNLKIGL
ncbi:MAG: hypothetical protein U5Q03_04120 [Bacteroidota bacterium]|nr:hypothetical protein [Bacteroidota bacterium]